MTVGHNYEEEAIAEGPFARATDPQTSHDAAETLAKSGKLNEQQRACLAAIYQRPGSTFGEVKEITGIEGCWKRLSELKNAGLIYASGTRKYKGRAQQRWWPVTGAPAPPADEGIEDTHVCSAQLPAYRVVRVKGEWVVQHRGRAPVPARFCIFCGTRLERQPGSERSAQPRLGL